MTSITPAIQRALAIAREDVQRALETNKDQQYWAAQGRAVAYEHVLLLMSGTIELPPDDYGHDSMVGQGSIPYREIPRPPELHVNDHLFNPQECGGCAAQAKMDAHNLMMKQRYMGAIVEDPNGAGRKMTAYWLLTIQNNRKGFLREGSTSIGREVWQGSLVDWLITCHRRESPSDIQRSIIAAWPITEAEYQRFQACLSTD